MPEIEVALHKAKPIAPAAVRQLYDQVGWWPARTLADIALVLQPDTTVGAWDDEQLIGFARAVSDCHLRVYIEDVMVHPAYRQRGVSKLLLDHLLDALAGIETITLFCEADLVPLYERHGFKARPTQKVLHCKKRKV